MRSQKKYIGFLASCLLAVAIISFGLLNVSGHIISAVQVSQVQVALTLEQKETEKEIFSLSDYSRPHCNRATGNSARFTLNTLYLIGYNKAICVKLQTQSKKLSSISPISHFIQLKRIPQNSDDPSKS